MSLSLNMLGDSYVKRNPRESLLNTIGTFPMTMDTIYEWDFMAIETTVFPIKFQTETLNNKNSQYEKLNWVDGLYRHYA